MIPPVQYLFGITERHLTDSILENGLCFGCRALGGAVHTEFEIIHLAAKPGRILKKEGSFAMMHKTHAKESGYCLGWASAGKTLGHDGSNTMWYASIKLDPETKSGVLVCVNSGSKAATTLCHEVVEWLEKER